MSVCRNLQSLLLDRSRSFVSTLSIFPVSRPQAAHTP